MAPRKGFAFLAELHDPFGQVVGRGVIEITDQAWHEMPLDVREKQAAALTGGQYAQPPYNPEAEQPPPAYISLSLVTP